MRESLLLVLLCFLCIYEPLSCQTTFFQDSTISKKYIPLSATLLAGGLIVNRDGTKRGIQDWIRERVEVSSFTVDDYIQHLPIATVLVSDALLGRDKEVRIRHIRHLLVSESVALGSMFLIKRITNISRPNGGGLSFPSGHTTYAFASAGVLYHSLKKDHPFWAYSGYAMASFVGASRVLRDKHWVSDVLFGAGLGILSSHLSYHLDIWDSRGDASLQKSSILSHISLGITPLGAGLTVEF